MGPLSRVLLTLLALVLIAAGGVSAWLFLYSGDLPNIEQLSEFAPTKAHLAAYDCLAGLSFVVPFDSIGKSFKDALTTAEPSASYPYQIARRLMCNRLESSARYQLDVFRLTGHIRRRFSEQELFTIYANTAYFGPAATGVENASQHFFQKSADTLSPEEAALLSGILRAPSVFSPFNSPDKALQRRNKILETMAAEGTLSANEVTAAVAGPLIIHALGNTEQKALPHGVLEALGTDESEYCDEFEGAFKKGCAETFRANLMWLQLQVEPGGVPGIPGSKQQHRILRRCRLCPQAVHHAAER
jgi:membrane carboxypeptidase/penicillin-binding protein